MVVMDERDKRPFSMARRRMKKGLSSCILALLKSTLRESSHGPHPQRSSNRGRYSHGEAWLRDDEERPMILIAGGPGSLMPARFC